MAYSQWMPKEGITRHAGSPIPEDMEFFASPLPEIGRVISADSTLTKSKKPVSLQIKLIFPSLLFLAAAFFFWSVIGPGPALLTGAILGVFLWLMIYVSTRFTHTCSYVGDRGIVEFKISGSRSSRPRSNLLCFKNAAHLYTSQTRSYYNGVYTGTSYQYRWTRENGGDYKLIGGYRSKEGWPDEKNPWHFANAAEAVWSNHKLQAVSAQLKQLGYVEFPMKGNPKAVRVGELFLEFVLKDGTTQKVAVADMKDIRLGSGVFQFKHKDTKWWSGKGKYSFTYAGLPDARLFLLCLDKLAGIRWS